MSVFSRIGSNTENSDSHTLPILGLCLPNESHETLTDWSCLGAATVKVKVKLSVTMSRLPENDNTRVSITTVSRSSLLSWQQISPYLPSSVTNQQVQLELKIEKML